MRDAGARATSDPSGRRRIRVGVPKSLLADRTEKRRARALYDALDRPLAFRRGALLTGAIVDAEGMLEIAEIAIGLPMIAQRRATCLDRVVQHRLDGIRQGAGRRAGRAGLQRDGRRLAVRRQMRAMQRLADVDVPQTRNDSLIRQCSLERGLLARARLAQHRTIE